MGTSIEKQVIMRFLAWVFQFKVWILSSINTKIFLIMPFLKQTHFIFIIIVFHWKNNKLSGDTFSLLKYFFFNSRL